MIRCTQQYNIKCLKCNGMYLETIRIGAINMCPDCFVKEFGIGTTEIDPESKLGKHYYKWLKKHRKMYII